MFRPNSVTRWNPRGSQGPGPVGAPTERRIAIRGTLIGYFSPTPSSPGGPPIKKFASTLFALALLINGLAAFTAPARADVICTKTADPATHGGLQALLNHVRDANSADPVACIPSGTYSINFALVIPVTMQVIGTGLTPPVISCTAATYCFDGTAGPSDVTLQDLSMDGAHKADIQIGSGADGSPVVTGWTLTGITTTGAGQVGITMNNASDITISNATITGNGSAPYDPSTNPTGDFGLRANRVDALTLQNSTIANNPTTASPNPGFSGGAKFNTTTNLLVQGNDFTGNAGGGQLWIDISSRDFDVTTNTIEEVPTAGTGQLPNDAIRVEVSCLGTGSNYIRDNTIAGGVVSAVDLYDSSGVTVQHNTISVPQAVTPNFGIRMFGNVHDVVPDLGCQQGGTFPNANNTATANTIDMTSTGNARNGVVNSGGTSSGNTWSANVYTVRHCDPIGSGQWSWWDGATNQVIGYTAWKGYGQDVDVQSSCTSIYPQVDGTDAFDPWWGPSGTVVTIHGSGFSNVTSVKFNKVVAPFVHDSDAQITATVPAGASTGTVCVRNPLNFTCSTTEFIVASGETLSVTPAGTGTGVITSQAPATGIDCGATCQSDFPQGGAVTLQALADASSTFTGWSGACSGTGTCTLTMDAAKDVGATFTLNHYMLSVAANGAGTGSITSNTGGINCPGTCQASYAHGSTVILSATPGAGSAFAGWSGACTGTGTCSLTMDAVKNVTGTFVVSSTTTLRDNDPAVAYNGWSGVTDATANGGAYRTSSMKNDRATWTSPVSTSITWATHTGPDQGRALVTIDGKSKGTVDLYTASAGSLSKAYTGLSNKAHTIVIKVLHTKSAASTGFNVRLDAFVVGATTTQESDPVIQYDTWKSVSQPKATDGTYRSSTSSTSTVTVTFAGTAIDWTTSKGAAYGMASVTIDGVAKGTFDLYQPTTSWKALTSFTGLSTGSHTMVVQVLGLKNASSTSTKVVVDGFIVHA